MKRDDESRIKRLFLIAAKKRHTGAIKMKHLTEKPQSHRKHIVIFLLASLFLAPQLSMAAKGGQGQGGGKGGAGEDGTACYTFEINEEISHDGNAEYCHGDDGQATVPSRFRIDLKKFNGNARQIFLDPICSGDDGELGTVDDVVNCFPGAAVAFQSQSEVLSDGSFNGELQFPDMRIANGPTRVTLSILFVEKHVKLHFGNDQSGVRCPESTLTGPTGPVWVKCTGESATTGSCNSWTLSTRDLSTNPVPDPARACLIHWKRELVTLDPVVEADFEFSISVIE